MKSLQHTWSVVCKALDNTRESHKNTLKRKSSRKSNLKLETKYSSQSSTFPIIRVINLVTVELKLPKNLQCIYLVFHCSLLKSISTSPLHPAMKHHHHPSLLKNTLKLKEILDSWIQRPTPVFNPLETFSSLWIRVDWCPTYAIPTPQLKIPYPIIPYQT